MTHQCFSLLCYKPNDIWIKFLSTFIKYDIYIFIDDNTIDYKDKYTKYNNINIIQIDDNECIINGFTNINFTLKKTVTSWEKSLYYFSNINTKYNNIWFCEDDVFFYNEETLLSIDLKYNNFDLLSNCYEENLNGHKNDWDWDKIDIKFDPPYYHAMMCCTRMSSKLLNEINNYAHEYYTLFYLEALFPTICKKYNMLYETPIEFNNIIYRKDYTDCDIDKYNLFHPVKDITMHLYYRNMLLH